MNEYEMVVIIVLIVSLAAVTIAVIAARARRSESPAADLALENRRLGGEVAHLKERIAVLERIATDKDHRLEREFERLRGA